MARVVLANEQDDVIGSREREALLPTDIHRASNLWLTNSQGDILWRSVSLRRRYEQKAAVPHSLACSSGMRCGSVVLFGRKLAFADHVGRWAMSGTVFRGTTKLQTNQPLIRSVPLIKSLHDIHMCNLDISHRWAAAMRANVICKAAMSAFVAFGLKIDKTTHTTYMADKSKK
jgi:hypothetical protein